MAVKEQRQTDSETAEGLSGLDQSKAGLQDDHDPGDIGQRVANKPGGLSGQSSKRPAPKQSNE
jgi:hypothetical protein